MKPFFLQNRKNYFRKLTMVIYIYLVNQVKSVISGWLLFPNYVNHVLFVSLLYTLTYSLCLRIRNFLLKIKNVYIYKAG